LKQGRNTLTNSLLSGSAENIRSVTNKIMEYKESIKYLRLAGGCSVAVSAATAAVVGESRAAGVGCVLTGAAAPFLSLCFILCCTGERSLLLLLLLIWQLD
jgi:hypothetical protein